MKVTVERMPQSSVALDIQADEDEFNQALEQAFRKINRQIRIPGFRPGRAPRRLVEQRFGRELLVDEAQRQIMDTLYRRALEQEDLTPVSEPTVDVYQDEPVGFRVEIQVYPTVDLGDYQAIRVEPREIQVTDEDVDGALKDLQLRNSVWITPAEPRQPRDDDQVIVDLQAFEGDEPFQEPVEDATFEIGNGSLFPKIEEALKQLHPGEQAEFEITFEEDDEKASPDLRGKTLRYTLVLKEIKERELPEIDDELARTVGDFDTLDELKERLRADLLRRRATEARSEVVEEAIKALTERTSVEIPPAMVERQIDTDLERLRGALSREGMSLEEFLRFSQKTLEEYRDELRDEAAQRVKTSVVLDAFAKAEKIELTEQDIVDEIDRLTSRSQNAEQMRQLYSSPYFQRMILDEMANRVLTDRLIAIVTAGAGAIAGEGARALEELEAAQAPAATTGEITSDADGSETEGAEEAADSETAAVGAAEDEAEPEAAGVAAAAAPEDGEARTEGEDKNV